MILAFVILGLTSLCSAHTAAWAAGMYCKGGNSSTDDPNTDTAVNPLYQLPQSEWWFQHVRSCDQFPPPAGEFLELPAGGTFTVELAHNRGETTLSFDGAKTSEWPDGQQHPEDWNAAAEGLQCLSDGAMHASDQSTTAGTAFAISYESDLSAVTMENLAVFTTLEQTPWKRIATYEVPAALPACPAGGCTCAWLWVPHLCGISNMYMHGFKCQVTGATSTVPVAAAEPPVYCADNPSTCVPGAKQMIAWNQASGNNIDVAFPNSPGYNSDCGWTSGAQNDIFGGSGSIPSNATTTPIQPVPRFGRKERRSRL